MFGGKQWVWRQVFGYRVIDWSTKWLMVVCECELITNFTFFYFFASYIVSLTTVCVQQRPWIVRFLRYVLTYLEETPPECRSCSSATVSVRSVSLKYERNTEHVKCQRALSNFLWRISLFLHFWFFYLEVDMSWLQNKYHWSTFIHTDKHTKSEALCVVEVRSHINGSPSSLASLSVPRASPA